MSAACKDRHHMILQYVVVNKPRNVPMKMKPCRDINLCICTERGLIVVGSCLAKYKYLQRHI